MQTFDNSPDGKYDFTVMRECQSAAGFLLALEADDIPISLGIDCIAQSTSAQFASAMGL